MNIKETSWHSYTEIYALGHRALEHLFDDDVLVEEKIDGSQFSFVKFAGELKCRSKGKEMHPDFPEKMFKKAVDVVKDLPLQDGWTYRAEYLSKPKHNSLTYDRVPRNNLIIFDVNTGYETYLPYEKKVIEAERIGLEAVPLLMRGRIAAREEIQILLETISCLGGQKIEGIVIKNYAQFGPNKKALMGKFVSEAFKEVHAREWKKANPKNGDIIQSLLDAYGTESRWQKALLHMREAGRIEDSPRDIGPLLQEVWPDIVKECREEIIDILWEWAADKIRRGVTRGLPQWYKNKLLERQCEKLPEKESDVH